MRLGCFLLDEFPYVLEYLKRGCIVKFKSEGKLFEVRLRNGEYEILLQSELIFIMDSEKHLEGYIIMRYSEAKVVEVVSSFLVSSDIVVKSRKASRYAVNDVVDLKTFKTN